ncbi:MAG TPA: M13-type metalloendopeptidase, partial [Tepidisphaeraceae bacterium]
AGSARNILDFETKIAEAHWTRAENRNHEKTYNPMTIQALADLAPGFDWQAMLGAAGVGRAAQVVVSQNTAMPKIARVFSETPMATLQAWQAFRVVDAVAPLLSGRFVDAHFDFHGKFMSGSPEQRDRAKRAASFCESAMGEAVGREYVARYFPPEAKAKAEALVADVRTAMRNRIEHVTWMSPQTQAKALAKMDKFGVKIGYPDHWRDYSMLIVDPGDLFGNAVRAARFQYESLISKLGRKVDRSEWGMTPQTVNAYYNPSMNEIVFPAAILQPPFFDPNADAAINYGGIGAVIGHEITHGFDDQGRKSDGNGVLTDWWTPDDAAKFEAQAGRLGAQYEAFTFPAAPGSHINGKATMGENIADLGGILNAIDAYHLHLNGRPAPVMDGFTGDQRVFLGWAQVWRTLTRDAALKQQLATDAHSPGSIRAFASLRNVDAWYQAFNIKPGDKLYLPPEDRVRIW